MAARVIPFQRRKANVRGYPHVACGICEEAVFTICTTEDEQGRPLFYMLICEKCGNEIRVHMTPVFFKDAEKGEEKDGTV